MIPEALALINRRLGDDAHRAWHWGSMRFLALGGACQTVVVTCPAAIAQHVPEVVFQSLSCFSLFCMIAAGVSRVTVPNNGDEHDRPSESP